MKSYFIKVSLLVVLFIFVLMPKSFSQTASVFYDSETSDTSIKVNSEQRLLSLEENLNIDSFSSYEIKDTLPDEINRIVDKSNFHGGCSFIILPLYFFDPVSTIKSYTSKDILRYRF